MATCSPGEFLILPWNSHISAISAMVLSGARPKYIIPQYDFEWDIASSMTSSQVEQAVKELEMEGQRAAAVFITSPTYHGICSNLTEISQLCHSHGIPLIVDEAHGAHLGFHPQLPNSALQQGADLTVQSTHKVLCSLTQSSMLHMSGNMVDSERICRYLQTLQSTSPSYLLLASLDVARSQLSENPDTIFKRAMELAFEAKYLIKEIPGISVLDLARFSNFPAIDPLRLTRDVPFPDIKMSLTPRDAFFASKNKVIIGESVGKVCGELICPYPPGITVMIPGEVITEKALEYLLDFRSKGAVITGASDTSLSSIVICNV